MFIDMLWISVKNLYRKKSRIVLTILGIAIGVASVVLISSLGEIGKYAINNEIDSLGVGGGVIISGNSKTAGTQLTEEHLAAVRASGVVESAVPIIVDYTKTYMREHMMDAVIWGIDYGANQVISLSPMYGRMITKNDVSGNKRVCIVDQNIALAYYKRDNIVGKKVSLQFQGGNEEFEVVGIVASGGNVLQGLMGSYIPSFIYIPYSTMQELEGKETIDQIAAQIRPGIDEGIAGERIVGMMNSLSNVKSGFKAENMESQKDKLDGVLNIITGLLSVIAGISLVVAGLSIMTVMLVSVGERTREIGIKKSIGASRHNILMEFLIESLSISLLGGIVGATIAIILVVSGCLITGLPICLNPKLISICILFAIFIGIVFGVYPAVIASRLHPVDALRNE